MINYIHPKKITATIIATKDKNIPKCIEEITGKPFNNWEIIGYFANYNIIKVTDINNPNINPIFLLCLVKLYKYKK